MAKVLILGGGFAGVVAAERLAKELGEEHQITLVSRSRGFLFYPALVRLAFGKCTPDDVAFDLRQTMLDRRVNFIEAEVAYIDPIDRRVNIAYGEVEGKLPYDYLVFALGRRLATERITGFYENAHHLMNVGKAMKLGKALAKFHEGRAIIGQCPGARLPVPVYETAFGLARLLKDNGTQEKARITVVSPDLVEPGLGDPEVARVLKNALDENGIEYLADVAIERVTPDAVITSTGAALNFNLLMLVPPFRGSSAASRIGITNEEGYINVDWSMRVIGQSRIYAIGDCVNFDGPKLGHMAVRQGEVAATNLVAEIAGREPVAHYSHEMKLVIDEGGSDSIYLYKDFWTDEPGTARQGRFWSWAKRVQQKYWEVSHS